MMVQGEKDNILGNEGIVDVLEVKKILALVTPVDSDGSSTSPRERNLAKDVSHLNTRNLYHLNKFSKLVCHLFPG